MDFLFRLSRRLNRLIADLPLGWSMLVSQSVLALIMLAGAAAVYGLAYLLIVLGLLFTFGR